MYFGTQIMVPDGSTVGAFVVALDPSTGALKWKTQMETHPWAIITSAIGPKAG